MTVLCTPMKKLAGIVSVSLMICWIVAGSRAYAQNDTLFRHQADSVQVRFKVPVSDSMRRRTDSILYTRFKQRMYKRRLTRQLYDALFRDVYNSQLKTGEVDALDNNPFREYAGKVIGTIYVRRLDVFGPSVYDTLRQSHNWFERFGSQLHANTRESVIRRQYLLFQEGDQVDPVKLRGQ